MAHLRPALVMMALCTLLFGLAYPMAITGIAQIAFPSQANGSLISRDGHIIGSSLIGQAFTRPEYFWPRPSAAGSGYNASASSGSNLGPTSRALVERVAGDVARLHAAGVEGAVPADLATTSASGLDPHISPAGARVQIARVASARGLPEADVARLVQRYTEAPFLGILGEPGVNVLRVNLALDEMKPVGP